MMASEDETYAQQTRMAVTPMALDPERVDTLVEWGMASDRATLAQALYELMTTDLRERSGRHLQLRPLPVAGQARGHRAVFLFAVV